MGVEVAVFSLAAGAISQVQQRKQAKKAAREEKKARQLAAAQKEQEAARARKQQLTEARQQRAEALAQGQAAGATGSSALEGAIGATASTAAANVGFMDASLGVQRGINKRLSNVARATERGAQFGAAATGFGQLFETAGGFSTIGSAIGF